ncbi:MAG: gliding motility-associated C-terminal domain-containing protein [Crocinitomicaceae bacterium]
MKLFLRYISILILGIQGYAQDGVIWLEDNAGQWNSKVQQRVKIPNGHLYIDNEGFTYAMSNIGELYSHDHSSSDENDENKMYRTHSIKAQFIGGNFNNQEYFGKSSHYSNYYLGEDPSKWRSKVYSYRSVIYHDLYEGVDLEFYGLSNSLKYNLLLSPQANPEQIKIYYQGQDRIKLTDEGLEIKTSLGTIVEKNPIAYYTDTKELIPIQFAFKKNYLSFVFPEGYDATRPILIDPEIVFSTYTGATSDNWGNTACPGHDGTLFAGGIAFGSGYPITTGAFQTTYLGGPGSGGTDAVISKFNEDGSQLVYSTFLGGSRSEVPHSMITNADNELFVLGSTWSNDFPTNANAFQDTVVLGISPVLVNGINFNTADAFIVRFSQDGSALLASTLYGGSSWDCLSNSSSLIINYGDQFRGEIMIDDVNNVYITGSTKSTDLPLMNPIKSSLSGSSDAFVAKFSPDLSTLLFATYLGGDLDDSGNSIQLSSTGDIFVGGGTNGNTFMSSFSNLYKGSASGDRDGYIAKINGTTFQLEAIRWIGTPNYDQAYFVQIDLMDNVYAYGQTRGGIQKFGCSYGYSNRGQFIAKFDNSLNSNIWLTTFGSPVNIINLSPTAFLVSDCGLIYIAGWGGQLNQEHGSSLVSNCNTLGMELTNGAFQDTTNGSNFYIAVFGPDMSNLAYATFIGGISASYNHVDGGTSRFDKNGNIYHAVCASCGGDPNGFASTPGAFSENNNSPNCNMAAFKFKLEDIDAAISVPTGIICLPSTVTFDNQSINSNQYIWDFGDGTGSTENSPEHLYPGPGIYDVTLIAIDTNNCFNTDTTSVQIEIGIFQGQASQPQDTVCPGSSIQLEASNGIFYQWEPSGLLDNPNSANPIATVDTTTVFSVIVVDSCGSDTIEVTVHVYDLNSVSADDTTMCEGDTIQISASGGINYHWEPDQFVINNGVANPFVFPQVTTDFTVEITTPEGCIFYDTANIVVIQKPPVNFLVSDEKMCFGDQINFSLNPNFDYQWQPNYNISSTNSPNVTVFPEVDTLYIAQASNICGVAYDTVHIDVIRVYATISPDTIICKGTSISVAASGGQSYSWHPPSFFSSPTAQNPVVTPPYPTSIWVEVMDTNGCSDSASMYIDFYPTTFLTVSPDYYGLEGDTAIIWANASAPGQLFWIPAEFINCTNCDTTFVFPPTTTTYTANFLDTNGCLVKNSVTIYFDPLIYVPNAFTPNGDGMNDFFGAKGGNFKTFELLIFNRWGELIFEGNAIDDWWDGKYKGEKVQDGVYVWKIRYEDLNSNIDVIYGHVTVLR